MGTQYEPTKIPVIVKIEKQLNESFCTWEEAQELGEHGVQAIVEEDLLGFIECVEIEIIFLK